MTDTNLKPEEIKAIDFPNSDETQGSTTISGDSSLDNLKPESSSGWNFPTSTIARTVIADSLNTQNKRILGEFQFGKSGAIKIGDKEKGEGEVAISPNGITAINKAGENTFTLDGTTGDATFKGTLAAGAIIANNRVYITDKGIIVNDGTNDRIIIGEW
jgi:hypothetical protein